MITASRSPLYYIPPRKNNDKPTPESEQVDTFLKNNISEIHAYVSSMNEMQKRESENRKYMIKVMRKLLIIIASFSILSFFSLAFLCYKVRDYYENWAKPSLIDISADVHSSYNRLKDISFDVDRIETKRAPRN